MKRLLALIFLGSVLQCRAQDKPTDLRYLYGSLTFVASPEKTEPNDVYHGTYTGLGGFFRFSSYQFMLDRAPKKFSVRDLISVRAAYGFGKGSQSSYMHLLFDVGLKIRYEVGDNVDIGIQGVYMMAMDHVSYVGFLPQAFARVKKIYVEAGGGANQGRATDKNRKYTFVSAKYYLDDKKSDPFFATVALRSIKGRNNQIGNQWESFTAVTFGVGKQF